MRLRLTAWLLVAFAFLIATHFNALGTLLQPANRTTDDSVFYWKAFAFIYVVVSFVTVFQPRLIRYVLVLTSVIAIAMLNRTLFFFWLGQRVVLANQILHMFLGGVALYLSVANQVYSWGFRATHVVYASLWLLAGLAPIAYAFAQEIEIVP